MTKHHRGGRFIQGDAMTFPLEGYTFIWASPPCQAHTALRHLNPGRTYPDLIAATRERLQGIAEKEGTAWAIENVPGAPMRGPNLTMLCGTMFGLQTPDGRAELRRHRLFETSFSIPLRPACQHGHVGMNTGRGVVTVTGAKGLPGLSHRRRGSLSIAGHAAEIAAEIASERRAEQRQRVICVVGGKAMSGGLSKPQGMIVAARSGAPSPSPAPTPQTNTVHNISRETFSVDDARGAMGIDWMPMRFLSQAIPPAYAEWIGKRAMDALGLGDGSMSPMFYGCQSTLF